MAILIVEHRGNVEGASLSGRVLIGRRASNHVVVDDPAVSRIHAWIDTADKAYCIVDAGSRTGTFVNGTRVSGKVPLSHGDRISIGPAHLIFRVDGSLPAGVSQLNFNDPTDDSEGGILFDCTCGAPLWVSSAFAGRMGKCRFCGAIIQVPQRTGVIAVEDLVVPSAPPASAKRPAGPTDVIAPPAPRAELRKTEACGVCQSAIEPGEISTTCPDCGLTFHAGCWEENFGCSAYGCSQVNALLPKTEPTTTPNADDAGQSIESAEVADIPPNRIPPAHALLAASVGGLIVGAFTFGIPALAAMIAALVYLRRHRGRRPDRTVIVALLIAVVGVGLGITISYVWWLTGGPADVDPG